MLFDKSHFLGKFALLGITALLTLALFDSNAWWKVLLWAIPATLLNLYLTGMTIQASLSPKVMAFAQGIAAALFAYLVSLPMILRTTFGTLVGFALLVGVAELLVMRFYPQKTP
ncbi:MAG TPA: hypothetical protein DDW87_06205 [Firmicutes bacterium]|nr:hypothetical protein [Bacillota bacterium]